MSDDQLLEEYNHDLHAIYDLKGRSHPIQFRLSELTRLLLQAASRRETDAVDRLARELFNRMVY